MADRRVFLDQLKNAHDLRQEFPFSLTDQHGRLVKPKPANGGKSVVGLCPFHARSSGTPSLSVSRLYFRCYGGCVGEPWEAGDIFTLTMKLEGLNFSEAVSFLAKETKYTPGVFVTPTVEELAPSPPGPLAADTMEKYFEPITPENTQILQNMGFGFSTLEWAGVRLLWPDTFAFPIWDEGALQNVKVYSPRDRAYKWTHFFNDRGKQMYLMDDALSGSLLDVTLYESEKDALLSRQWDIPSAATGGAGVWRKPFTKRLLVFEEIYGVKDLDVAGENWSKRIKRELPRFIPVDWRLLDPAYPEGFDLGKYILKGGTREQYYELLTAAKEERFVYEGL